MTVLRKKALSKVEMRLNSLSAALLYTKAQVLVLYESVIENNRWTKIVAKHYETYGRRSFETIVKEPYLTHQNFLLGKF